MTHHASIVRIAVLTLALSAGALPASALPTSTPMLRADANRDGVLTAADDARRAPAIMMANLDDDQSRCTSSGPRRLSDEVLAACNDAADEVVNGPEDLKDLAPVEIRPTVNSAGGTLAVDRPDKVRVFVQRAGRFVVLDGALTRAELRHGVRLAVEARDIVRDRAEWSGQAELRLRVGTRTDRLRLQVAPVLFENDTMPLRRVVVADPAAPATLEGQQGAGTEKPGQAAYERDLRNALDAEGLTRPFVRWPAGGDQWLGDMYKTAYMSMPAPGGKEHRMAVNLRAPGIPPQPPAPDRPLRDASRPVFTLLRGPDVAGIQEYDPERANDPESLQYYGSASSASNFGTLPPDRDNPLGRILYGGAGRFVPDGRFTGMLAAQGYQDPIMVDTTWLGVGHLDEFLHFVPSNGPRGWSAVVADPALGMGLLRRLDATGHGGDPLVRGVDPAKTDHPGLTVSAALRLPELVDGTRIATAGVAKALRQLRDQAGLTERDIVRVPALFKRLEIPAGYPRDNLTVTALPDAANGVSTGTGAYLAPRQHGPRRNGRDVFESATEQALGRAGVRVRWIEDWEFAHHVGTAGGEIHCVTNVERDLSGTRAWWKE